MLKQKIICQYHYKPIYRFKIYKKSVNKNNFKTKPLEPTFNQGLTSFPLEIGQINQLEISNWKWNQISVGIILIIALTLLSLSLQRLRLQMGFGFPELPP